MPFVPIYKIVFFNYNIGNIFVFHVFNFTSATKGIGLFDKGINNICKIIFMQGVLN